MHNPHYDDASFTHKYIIGLKEELRGFVEAQMPTTVLKASILARVQQKILDRGKSKYGKTSTRYKTYNTAKQETKPPAPSGLFCGKTDNSETIGRLMDSVTVVGRNLSLVTWEYVLKELNPR